MAIRYMKSWFLMDVIVFIPLIVACIPSLCSNRYAQLSQVRSLASARNASSSPAASFGRR